MLEMVTWQVRATGNLVHFMVSYMEKWYKYSKPGVRSKASVVIDPGALHNTSPTVRKKKDGITDLLTSGKGKSGDPWKKTLEILQKILKFFSPFNPLSIEGTRHQPHSQGLLPFQNGGQCYWAEVKKTARNRAWYKQVVSTVLFFISLSLYGTGIPREYSIFIQQFNLFHFRKIFPKNPWEWEPLSETREKWQKIVRLSAEPWELAGLE